MRERAGTVLVLDLDDTLYNERDYVVSGRAHVFELIAHSYGRDVRAVADAFLATQPSGDLWLHLTRHLGLPDAAKSQFLWAYRLHRPAIGLAADVRAWLDAARRTYAALAIITDGRSTTQRLKLAALGLGDLPAYISEEWDSEKPHPARFEAVMQRWAGRRYAYVGDNPSKDFRGPDALGWTTIGLVGLGNVHPQPRDVPPPEGPRHWVTRLADVDQIIDGDSR